jgi:hypothetical protein
MVLYEAHFQISFAYFIPFLLLVFSLLLPTVIKKYNAGNMTNGEYKGAKIFCSIAVGFIAFIILLVSVSTAVTYNSVISAYKHGNYKITEGYVEDFVPMPYTGHSEETFGINGVKFAYSDYDLSSLGYNKTKSHGGVITGNGQHLKVGYVHYNNSNVIVYIEQLGTY